MPDFVLVQATRESEAVPYQRRACALTTAPTALRSGSSGNYRHQSESQLYWRTRTVHNLLQPSACRSWNNRHFPQKRSSGADNQQQRSDG